MIPARKGTIMRIDTGALRGVEVAMEMVWLAWKACGGPLGLGFLQDRPDATEEEVWLAMVGAHDYGGIGCKGAPTGEVNADYVFGRMMKLYFEYGEDFVDVREDDPKPDYQAWCREYPSYEALAKVAIESVGSNAEVADGGSS